jgi:hypothetical protein
MSEDNGNPQAAVRIAAELGLAKTTLTRIVEETAA